MLVTALLLAAATPHPAALAGLYDGGRSGLAATLMLRPDGYFGYALSDGTRNEDAAGTWEAEGGTVYLTTRSPVTAPRFVVEHDTPDIMGGFSLRLVDPARLRGRPLGALLFYAPDEPPVETTVAPGGRVILPDSRRPSALLPLLPGASAAGDPIFLAGKGGRRLIVRFAADAGNKADFRGEPLTIDGDSLILHRPGRTLRFHRR
jgi:hypothetical protein